MRNQLFIDCMQQNSKHSIARTVFVRTPTKKDSTCIKTRRAPKLMKLSSSKKEDVAHVNCYFLDGRRKDTRVFLVDADLWRRKLSQYHWYLTVNARTRKTYVACGDYQHPWYLHRMVYQLVHGADSIPADKIVDHCKGNSFDNRINS